MHIGCNYDKIPMMKKTQKTLIKVLQGILILTTLVTMIALGIFLWNLISNTPNEEEPPIVTNPDYVFVLNDYTYYKSDDLDFNFIIADVTITSNVVIKLPLSTLTTSENISLASTDDYLSILATNNLKPGLKGLSFSFNSDAKTVSASIFIPVMSKTLSEVRLTSNVPSYTELKIDLTNQSKLGDISTLKITDDTVVNNPNEDLTFTFGFADYFEPSNFYTVGPDGKAMSVDIGTNNKVFGISYTVVNSDDFSYKINQAELIVKGVNTFPLMNPEYLLMSTTNLASVGLVDSQTGVLFFLVPAIDSDMFSYPKENIQVKLTFSNNEEMLIENAIGK